MNPSDWPSLRPQLSLAETLVGRHGVALVKRWFDDQIKRISDPAFARIFTDHITLKGLSSGDYNHRHIRHKGKALIGGIRFFGQNTTRPFVEVIAHDFDDYRELRKCVAAEWQKFAPLHIRLLQPPDLPMPRTAFVDMSIHATRYRHMENADNRVSLDKFASPTDAEKLVNETYCHLAATDRTLADNISAALPDDLRHWHQCDQIRAINVQVKDRPATVGLLAIAPGGIEWITGDEVNEEVILPAHRGHGFATAAQCAWAQRTDIDRNRLMVGTIDRLNTASRRTAIKAGRHAVLHYLFLPIDGD